MIQQVTNIRNTLGECPVWSARTGTLFWMDLVEPGLYALDTNNGETRRWDMPEYLGGLSLRESGGLVVGMQHRIAAFSPKDGTLEELYVFPEQQEQGIRFNDSTCDAAGRFLVGNMKDESLAPAGGADKEKRGSLYVLGVDRSLTVLQTGLTIPNGFTWNLGENILYVADSHESAIYAYDYDVESGTLGARRVFAVTEEEDGVPDGSCLDEEGYLWTAINGGWRIVRYAPDGTAERSIMLPTAAPTSVAFGGEGLETLYITTACQNMTEQEKREQPLAGMLLAVTPGVRGVPVHAYKG